MNNGKEGGVEKTIICLQFLIATSAHHLKMLTYS